MYVIDIYIKSIHKVTLQKNPIYILQLLIYIIYSVSCIRSGYSYGLPDEKPPHFLSGHCIANAICLHHLLDFRMVASVRNRGIESSKMMLCRSLGFDMHAP